MSETIHETRMSEVRRLKELRDELEVMSPQELAQTVGEFWRADDRGALGVMQDVASIQARHAQSLEEHDTWADYDAVYQYIQFNVFAKFDDQSYPVSVSPNLERYGKLLRTTPTKP